MEEISTYLGMGSSSHENCFLQENMLEHFHEKTFWQKKELVLEKFLALMLNTIIFYKFIWISPPVKINSNKTNFYRIQNTKFL